VEGGHVVIGPVHVLDGDVRGELGEGLEEFREGEVVLMRHRLRILSNYYGTSFYKGKPIQVGI